VTHGHHTTFMKQLRT